MTVWALIFVVVTSAMVVSHSAYMASHRRTMDVHLQRKPLASSFARAGLTDALSWFQGQPTQPVTTFDPIADPSGDPPVVDTIDPTVGLVRAFEIQGNLWGRYEIRKSEVADRSAEYGIASPGSLWELAARGYVYRVVDPNRPFDEAPNKIVSSSRMTTEIRGVPVNLPARAALSIEDPTLITVLSGGKIVGGGGNPGVAHPDPGSVALLIPTGVSGTPQSVALGSFQVAPLEVFGMTLAELRDVADMPVSGGSVDPGALRPRDKPLIFVDGDLTIPTGAHLDGGGLLVVDGNFTAMPDNDSFFRGVIYVTGDTDVVGSFTLVGSLVGRGAVRIAGNGTGKDAVVKYDDQVLDDLQRELQRYRQSRTLKPVRYESEVGSKGADGAIDPTATIDPTVDVGHNVHVGYMTQVQAGCRLGDDVSIGRNAALRPDVEIGGGTTIDDNVVIQTSARIGRFVKIGAGSQIGAGAEIEDGAQVGAGVTINDGARVTRNAVIPDGTTY